MLGRAEVHAQTSTPVPPFSTVAPGATSTPGAVGSESVFYDFVSGQGDFAVTIGSWESGIGFISDTGILTVLGGFPFDDRVNKATFYYSATAGGSWDFALNDETSPPAIFESSGGFSTCATECSIFFSPPSLEFTNLAWAVDAGVGDIIVTGLKLEFGASADEDYEVDGDGCPILTEDQISRLDPRYFSQCSHCFATPTPARDMPIASVALPSATLNTTLTTTFSIPIIVSGTAMTSTPFEGLPGGGLFTETPTPQPTFTPGSGGCVTYAGASLLGGWEGVPFGFGHSTVAFWNGSAYESVFTPAALGEIARIHRDWDGSRITRIEVTRDASCTRSTSDSHVVASYIFGGDVLEDFVISNACPYNLTNDTHVFILDEVGVTSIDITSSVWSDDSTAYTRIKQVKICGDVPATSTPTPIGTTAPTLAPWIGVPTFEPVNCEVAVFGEFDPVAEFDPEFTIYGYDCYLIVPEVDIDIPGNDGLHVDGVEWCITWFEFPLISVLGIVVSLDWLLVVIAAFLVRLFMAF